MFLCRRATFSFSFISSYCVVFRVPFPQPNLPSLGVVVIVCFSYCPTFPLGFFCFHCRFSHVSMKYIHMSMGPRSNSTLHYPRNNTFFFLFISVSDGIWVLMLTLLYNEKYSYIYICFLLKTSMSFVIWEHCV